jgi:hypothetical protein
MRFWATILLSLAIASPALARWVPPSDSGPVLGVGYPYECRSSDFAQTIVMVVGRIDETDQGRVVSVSIRPKGGQVRVAHVPIWEQMASKYCVPLPPYPAGSPDYEALDDNFEDGYRQWRQAFDAKQAGAWTLSPGDVYATLLKQMPAKP